MSPTHWTTLLCLLAGAICTILLSRLLFRPTARLKPATPVTQRGVHLVQVKLNRDDADTDIDIIAIHGLDTTSRDTWTWKDPRDPKNQDKWVNWLHPGMLPESVHRARIFTCDWPANLLEPSDLVQKTMEEYALLLLEGIQRVLFGDAARREDRPIVFIASCLGGIILMKALVHADDKRSSYYRLRRAARGIVFLATPFRGTSFQDVAAWAEPGLKAKASIQGRKVSRLLDSVKGSTFDLEELVHKFTQLCQDKGNPCEVFNFYELQTTSLPLKVFPWLPTWLRHQKQLVNKSSATLDIIPDPLSLDRRHSLMNKFHSPKCADYQKVADQIEKMVGKIREGTRLQQADAWIRKKHYNADKLRIERLSGDLLPMDQCYINLAIVEQSGLNTGRSNEGGAKPSPFSLFARQKVETSDRNIEVKLPTIFNERKGHDGSAVEPRRILIRGRAGVGKTTLCKKIVYEFSRGTWSEWTKMFNRVLWVPLRNLKLPDRRQIPGYNFEHLFIHEYFSLPKSRPDLARELSDAVATDNNKTLFLLDGLDEVSQDLGAADAMSRFLTELLKQPNVIITSRPSAKPPPDLDLELETIGFYPDQVQAYLDADPNMKPKANQVQLFLREHWLIQGLVRIPIQLDALCYAWEDFSSGTAPDTMTGIYNAIEYKLWKKDIERLGKQYDGKPVTASQIDSSEVKDLVEHEAYFLEGLAFTGMHSDTIDFTSEHRKPISKQFNCSRMLLHKTLPNLSFLRTSDPSSRLEDRNYHFIHLTFQEYFAARYFVRQWKDHKQLEYAFKRQQDAPSDLPTDPVGFLQKHKYSARYDVFWRFVAGLLDADGQANRFIDIIEEKPLDLLGPTHQRLVMHCLSEISGDLRIRVDLERRLSKWLLFECRFDHEAQLASEVEFPEQALDIALREGSDVKATILEWLYFRATLPPRILAQVAPQLEDENWRVREAAIGALGCRPDLPEEILAAVAAGLEDENWRVRGAAIEALGDRSDLPEEILAAVAAGLEDEDWRVRWAAVQELGRRPDLPEKMQTAVEARLEDENERVREAVRSLGRRSDLSEKIKTAVATRLEDKVSPIRAAAIGALGSRLDLEEKMPIAAVAQLEDGNWKVRVDALEELRSRSDLSEKILTAVAARLGDKHPSVQMSAWSVMRKNAKSYYTLLSGPHATSLYRFLFRQSFKEQLSWYIDDGHSCVNMPEGITRISIENQQNDIRVMINEARPADTPSICGSG
ncbi:nacht nucleoside triphosphatase [Ilyonectria robusta]|uniref:nacht nucleoside triphosphatase n=1 Tax=Ilyonectria robusta TaxID=1079257 RepID=UPI001E8EEE15|nr:nacht nucleoside triphosphatase [Ilyonectria robusta]KAH8714733.1 nacht nucleoside triphosphatase [Ilyonectria robusta]